MPETHALTDAGRAYLCPVGIPAYIKVLNSLVYNDERPGVGTHHLRPERVNDAILMSRRTP